MGRGVRNDFLLFCVCAGQDIFLIVLYLYPVRGAAARRVGPEERQPAGVPALSADRAARSRLVHRQRTALPRQRHGQAGTGQGSYH